MRSILFAAILSLGAAPALAQEVPVPGVTTASPGGYANPLKLDTDRYKEENGETKPSRPPAPFGRCNWEPLTEAQSVELSEGYWLIVNKSNHHQGYRWLNEQCGATNASQLQRRVKRAGDPGVN